MMAVNGYSLSATADDPITGTLPFNIQTCNQQKEIVSDEGSVEINYSLESWRCPDPSKQRRRSAKSPVVHSDAMVGRKYVY